MVPIIMNNNHKTKIIKPGKIYVAFTITQQRISHQQILFVLTTAVTLMSILRVKLLPTCDNLIFSTPTNIAIFMAIV